MLKASEQEEKPFGSFNSFEEIKCTIASRHQFVFIRFPFSLPCLTVLSIASPNYKPCPVLGTFANSTELLPQW